MKRPNGRVDCATYQEFRNFIKQGYLPDYIVFQVPDRVKAIEEGLYAPNQKYDLDDHFLYCFHGLLFHPELLEYVVRNIEYLEAMGDPRALLLKGMRYVKYGGRESVLDCLETYNLLVSGEEVTKGKQFLLDAYEKHGFTFSLLILSYLSDGFNPHRDGQLALRYAVQGANEGDYLCLGFIFWGLTLDFAAERTLLEVAEKNLALEEPLSMLYYATWSVKNLNEEDALEKSIRIAERAGTCSRAWLKRRVECDLAYFYHDLIAAHIEYCPRFIAKLKELNKRVDLGLESAIEKLENRYADYAKNGHEP